MRFPPRSGALILTLLILPMLDGGMKARADEKKPEAVAVTKESSKSENREPFEAHVRPLLTKYCVGCHGSNKPKAGLNLEKLTDSAVALKSHKTWNKVRESLEGSLMPPDGKPHPSQDEIAALISWLERTEEKLDCTKAVDPGRVTVRRLNRSEYRNTIRDLTGVDFHADEDFPSDDVGYGFDNIGDVLTLPPLLLEKYLAAAGTIAEQAIRQEMKEAAPPKILVRKPKGPEEFQECARVVLERFSKRAYRRPVSGGEVARLLKLFNLALENGDGFERGIRLAVEATLVAPHFLFRVELFNSGRRVLKKGENSPQALPIGSYELASRLSYFLWSSMPDDELFQLAEEESLCCPDVLDLQIRRMLKNPKSRSFVENFAGQWLQLRNLKIVHPDRDRFPSFDDPLRNAMIRETELFFGSILDEDRSLVDFLDADYTFLNERLARHYGVSGVRGDEFRRVIVSPDQRGGLLTQASILTVTSNPTRTSPVKRGKWILEQILGTPPPPPPPDVPELDTDQKAALSGTVRQRLEQHRTNPSCASCHSRMDPLGFGLENYDPIGAWRDKDGAFAIDSSGTLPSGQSFQGAKGLKAVLRSKKTEFTRCLTEKLLIYAIGRGLEDSDHCFVDQIVKTLESENDRFSRLILEIVLSDPFQKRRG
ncbi:MAG: hypothetical protein ABS79_07435 [Planctomycetes bacterium SCN 63-9]|nr:MAG: hypothetical protein ABS79_07435 [Planctomycetes bacterium SCN 63-9]